MRPVLVAVLLVFVAASAHAQKHPKCIGDPPDSTLTAAGPVYRNCEVDTPAKPLTKTLKPNWGTMPLSLPVGRCLVAGFTFVIDTLGVPEENTIRPQPHNSPEVEEVVLDLVKRWRFEPATLEGRAVRQFSIYRTAFGSYSMPSGRSGGSPSSMPPVMACRP